MRRRFGRFLDKVVDRPQSTSPAGTRSPSQTQDVEGCLSTTASTPLLNPHLLKERYQTVQHEELKLSIVDLIGFLESVDGSLDTTIISRLKSEINDLSGIISLLSENHSLSSSHKLSEELARAIDSALKKARVTTSYPSQWDPSIKTNYHKAISQLSDNLHTAIESHRAQSANPQSSSSPAANKTARAISGKVAGSLSIVKEMLDGIPVPGLKAAVGGLLEVLNGVNELIDNDDDLLKLIDHLRLLVEIVSKPIVDGKVRPNISLEQRVQNLTENIDKITTDAMKIQEQNLGSKFLGRADNASAIAGLSTAIDRAVDRFQVSGTMGVEKGIGDIRDGVERVENDIGKVQHELDVIGKGVLSGFEEAALNAIYPRADSARYDSGSQLSSAFCLEDTRVALLQQIEQWVEDPNSRPIFWLCGMAGTGKSTIARTVAKLLDQRQFLGASFFFSRDEDDRRRANLVFPTIAYQLARRIPSLREHIIRATSPDVCTAMMRTQLNKLIVEPVQRSQFSSSTLVIVMDALDECASESQITEMLVLLAPAIRLIQKTISIKLFLTSRPEVHISAEFREPGMQAVSNVSILHDIEKSLVRTDISRYVEHHLQRIGNLILPLNAVWPTVEEKEALINMADGLFIFAAVTVAFIGDTKYRQPKQRLRNLLSDPDQKHASASLMHLDVLYQQILMASLPDNDKGGELEQLKLRIREILGTVVLLLYPLSSQSLEKLLGWEEYTVEPTLGPFHSVLSMTLDQTPIRVFHKSFPDFLMDKRRSSDHWYHIDPIEHHGRLALLCLTHMNTSLRRDMCGVGNQLVSELGDVESILLTKVGAHILYACRYWEAHLKEAEWTDELGAALKEFCECKIPYWLEILCLDRKLISAVLAVDSASKWALDEGSSATLTNCYRYLLYFHTTIALGPSHIYQSTLPFVPRLNLSSSPWEKELHSSPRVVMTSDSDTWDRILFTLTGHYDQVQTVAYSPNGGLLASGSDDNRVIIWDSRTGVQIHSLEGHSGRVLAIAFSPDGSLIASGSDDNTVRIWSSVTGILNHTLRGHLRGVTAVSFSPVGTLVASRSSDQTATLWDSGTGSRIRNLHDLSEWSWTISFSPDGTQIVSQSSDSSIMIWNTESGAIVSELKGDGSDDSRAIINAIAFSPDGTHLISADDKEVIIWDYKSRTIFKRLEEEAICLAFSLDGRFIVTGRINGQIVTWDVIKGSPVGIFEGHTKAVVSIAVSPDGSRILTGSYDRTAAVWDMRNGWESPGVNNSSDKKAHTQAVLCVAFSPDGNRLVSVAEDGSLAVWSIGRHQLIHSLKGYRKTARAVTYSADGRYFACVLDNKNIVAWDVEIGECIKTLNLDIWVEHLEFSLDGLYLFAAYQEWSFRFSWQYSTSWKKWSTQDFEECQLSSPEVEEAKEVQSGTPANSDSPSGTYLAQDKGSQWVEKRCQRITVERLCHLPQHDVTASASVGRYFAFGTSGGTIYLLDFPPETFGITSTGMYTDAPVFYHDSC